MLVPAIAFGWWVASVSVPPTVDVEDLPVARPEPARVLRPASPRPGATADGDAMEAADRPERHERVKLSHPITAAIVKAARSYLDLPMGSEREEEVDGLQLVFVLEPHYHPPGFKGGPNGWHKGVTVYERR
jgi:hypothetical protein